MKRNKFIYSVLLGLSYFFSFGQQIGNYVNNGSFEDLRNPCSAPMPNPPNPVLKYWSSVDTTKNGFMTTHTCYNGNPNNGAGGYQWSRTGNGYVRSSIYIQNSNRGYFRNRLKANLIANKVYCVKFYVNVIDFSPYGVDSYGAYFGNSELDAITNPYSPITNLVPQIQNPPGNFVTDTLNWVPISGTFTANGTEKYMVIGNFKSDANTGTVQIQPPYGWVWCDINVDDVSCMEVNMSAYAGSDKLIYAGDSAFIGRQSDYAIDPYCIWYKVPNMSNALDTVSGMWVKPAVTSTYVVRQELDCGSLKWDTVIVAIDTVPRTYVGLEKFQLSSDNIKIFPNPTSGNLNISFPDANTNDIVTVSIIDNLGQSIREDEIEIKNKLADVHTTDLAPGLYQIQLRMQFGNATKRFVKTN